MRIDLIPLGVQFTFDAKFEKNWERVEFYRNLYGYVNNSNFKKYKYNRKGILSELKHLRPTNSVIILTLKDAPVLRKFLRGNKVKFSENIVVLHHSQARKLGVESNKKWLDVYRDLLGKRDLLVTWDW